MHEDTAEVKQLESEVWLLQRGITYGDTALEAAMRIIAEQQALITDLVSRNEELATYQNNNKDANADLEHLQAAVDDFLEGDTTLDSLRIALSDSW